MRARQRLPRVEDLPPGEHGYDREQVREAFDSFYRHIAQLDATVRALEAVEVFRDQAGELRKELRALKAAGWTQQPWPAPAAGRVSPGLPDSLPRFAIEAAFLIIVAVVVAVAGFDRLSIVLVMALAWAIVGVVEWAASRERFARTRVPAPVRASEAPAPAPLRVVPAQAAVAAPAESWELPAAAADATGAEDLTNISASDRDASHTDEAAVEIEPVAAAGEPALELPAEVEPEAEPEPEPPEAIVDVPAGEEPVEEPVEESEFQAEAAEVEEEQEPSRWSWASDSAVERARERELAERPQAPRRRFWQRRHRDHDGFRLDAPQPRHVRVLPPEPSFDEQFPVDRDGEVDPWEQDLDLSIEEPEGSVDGDREREAALDRGERS